MSFVKSVAIYLALSVILSACSDDLTPSDKDERSTISAGTLGNQVGQISADFSVSDNIGEPLQLSELFNEYDAVVLYFTMWCSVCDSHMSSIRESVKPDYPNVKFLTVDYVSSTTGQSRNTQLAYGYASETVIADTTHELLNLYDGSMGRTIVLHNDLTVLMNESYQLSKLERVLSSLSK